SEFAFAKAGLNVLGGLSGQRDFKIVNQRRSVHCDAKDKTSTHQVCNQWAKASLDHVSAHTPEDGSALAFRLLYCGNDAAEVSAGKDGGERIQKAGHCGTRRDRLRKGGPRELALS